MSSDIDELRREIDIVEVISEYINLERVGSNYRANCPFHPDRTPSFYVSPTKQIFKCFGCGVGGDAIKFVSLYENISYLEAALELAKKYGKHLNLQKISKNEKILIALDRVADFYMESLHRNEEALEYLRSRGISGNTLKRFGLGFAPSSESLVKLLKSEGLLEDYLKTKNLIKISENTYRDLFLKRVVVPIRNPSGRVIGFGGRRIKEDNSPKYINSPDSDVFKKGKNLFGLFEAKDYIRDEGYAILVEGYFDVLKLFSEGIKNVVAPLGTALTQEQAELLSKYTKKAYLLYDGDSAGQNAMSRAIPLLLKAGLEVYPVYLPEGHDPDSFIDAFGVKELKNLIKRSKELFTEIIEKASEDIDKYTRDFRYYLSFLQDDIKKIALATEYEKRYKVPVETLLSPIKEKERKRDMPWNVKVLLKGFYELKPKVSLEELELPEDIKELCRKALNGEEHELPKDIFEMKVSNLDKVFWSALDKVQQSYKKLQKKRSILNKSLR